MVHFATATHQQLCFRCSPALTVVNVGCRNVVCSAVPTCSERWRAKKEQRMEYQVVQDFFCWSIIGSIKRICAT